TIRVPPADSKVTKQETESVVMIVGKAAYERGWAAMEPSPFDRRPETGMIVSYVGKSVGGHQSLNVTVWVPEDRSEIRVGIADWAHLPEQLRTLRDEIRQGLEAQYPDRHLVVTDDDIGFWPP